jgi:hypothetical protein
MPLGFKHSEATKQKLREIRLGDKNPFFGKKHSEEFKAKKRQDSLGVKNHFYGKTHTEESKHLLSVAKTGLMVGERNPNFGKPRDPETREKIRFTRISKGIARRENNPNWRGGISSSRQAAMATTAYKQWRTAVFTHDDYTCQHCARRGGDLEADHIKPWAFYPDLRYTVDNGRTLCVECHRKTFKDLAQHRRDAL